MDIYIIQTIFQLFNISKGVYFIGDLNGRSRGLGYSSTNTVGQQIDMLVDRGHAVHEGPNFPTFISNRSQTTPDIILTNKHAIHNTYAEQGPLVTSDHTPIVYTINSSPIQIPIKQRHSFKQANWQGYKQQLLQVPADGILRDQADLEAALDRWTTQIQAAAGTHVPKVCHRTVPGVKSSPRLDRLKNLHQRIYKPN